MCSPASPICPCVFPFGPDVGPAPKLQAPGRLPCRNWGTCNNFTSHDAPRQRRRSGGSTHLGVPLQPVLPTPRSGSIGCAPPSGQDGRGGLPLPDAKRPLGCTHPRANPSSPCTRGSGRLTPPAQALTPGRSSWPALLGSAWRAPRTGSLGAAFPPRPWDGRACNKRSRRPPQGRTKPVHAPAGAVRPHTQGRPSHAAAL